MPLTVRSCLSFLVFFSIVYILCSVDFLISMLYFFLYFVHFCKLRQEFHKLSGIPLNQYMDDDEQ